MDDTEEFRTLLSIGFAEKEAVVGKEKVGDGWAISGDFEASYSSFPFRSLELGDKSFRKENEEKRR